MKQPGIIALRKKWTGCFFLQVRCSPGLPLFLAKSVKMLDRFGRFRYNIAAVHFTQ